MATGKFILSKYATNFFNGQLLSDIANGIANTDVPSLQQIKGGLGYGPVITVSVIAGRADFYTGDYASDDLCIQAAIAQLVSQYGGGIILLKPGTYNLAATIDIPLKCGVIGMNRRTVLVKTNANDIAAFQMLGATGEANYDFDQILANIEVRGNNNAAHSSNFGLILKYSTNFIISNVYFRQCYYSVFEADAYDGIFKDCIFKEAQQHSVRLISLDADANTRDIIFDNCIFNKCSGSGQLFYGYRNNASTGVACNLPDNITLINCKFTDAAQASVRWEGNTLNIINCKSYTPGFHNFRISSDGLGGKNCKIINSYGDSAGQNGMYFDNDFQTIENLQVRDTTIVNSAQHGIAMQGSINYLFDGLTIKNSGYGSGGTSYDAIFVNAGAAGRSFDNLKIKNCRAYDNQGTKTQGYGIDYSAPSGGSTITNIIIEDCDFTGNATGTYNTALNTYIVKNDVNGKANYTAGIQTKYSTFNSSNPPTSAELISAFGTAASAGAGFMGILNDNAGGTNEYYCWSDGTNWFYSIGTKAV